MGNDSRFSCQANLRRIDYLYNNKTNQYLLVMWSLYKKKSSETCHASVTGKKKSVDKKNQFGNLPGDSNERQKKPKKSVDKKKSAWKPAWRLVWFFFKWCGRTVV